MHDIAQKTDSLSVQSRRVAILVAHDEISDAEIARQVGIGLRTLMRWKTHPTFQTHVRQHVAELSGQLATHAIARKDKRVAEYDDRWQRLKQMREERAADPTFATIPGGSTGLVIRRLKVIGTGTAARTIEEYEIDTGALNAMLALERQAAQEIGQWTEKSEHAEVADVSYTITFDRVDQ